MNIKSIIDRIEREIEGLQNIIYDLKVESVHQRKSKTKDHHLVFSDFWTCKQSPTGCCVYDLDSDLRYDDCIFCHKPDERK